MHTLSYLTLALGAALLLGCDPADSTTTGPVYGTAQPLGNGTARTFVQLDDAGTPAAVGVVLSEEALNGLPDGPVGHTMDGMMALDIPATAGLPYRYLSLGWNPHGHEPEGLFTVPHFDFHFYTVAPEEVMAWMPGQPGFDEGATPPDARYVPPGFIGDPSGQVIPMMGYHWLDASDPTYAPGGPGFTEVFIFGSYRGAMTFAEPMITKAYLESHPDHTEDLPQPEAVAADGYYPTRYTVRWDAANRQYVIALEGLVYRTAS